MAKCKVRLFELQSDFIIGTRSTFERKWLSGWSISKPTEILPDSGICQIISHKILNRKNICAYTLCFISLYILPRHCQQSMPPRNVCLRKIWWKYEGIKQFGYGKKRKEREVSWRKRVEWAHSLSSIFLAQYISTFYKYTSFLVLHTHLYTSRFSRCSISV